MEDSVSDNILLARFQTSRDEEAFHQLVSRYIGMVLGVAQRRTGDHQAAEEIAQNTFSILAQKAHKFSPEVVLGGWLHRVATIEAAEFNRREYRRRRVMNELQQASDANTHSPDSHAFSEYLPDLDEAMARLSIKDRNALMLRFHTGLRFGEMAVRLGKSEDAARKQVSRALNKLGTLLGKRHGTPITIATITAGLPLALTKSASATMASTVSTSALASLPAMSAAPHTLKLLYAMKTQTGIITILGLLLLAGSFVTGRQSAAGFGTALITEAEDNVVQRQKLALKMQAVSQEAPLPQPRTVQQILDAAAAEYQEGSAANYYRARLILEELDPQDFVDALAHLETHRTDERLFNGLGALLAGLWAQTDGPAAIAWVDKNLSSRLTSGYHKVLASWSKYAPTDAYAWYQEKAEAGDSGIRLKSFRSLSKPVFSGWAEKNPRGAIAALSSIAIEDERGAFYGIAEAVQHSLDPEPILNAIEESEESPLRNKLIEEVGQGWAREELHSAAAWVDAIPMASGKARIIAKGEIAEEWVRQHPSDMLEIGAWFLTGAPADMRADLKREIANAITASQQGDK